MIIPTTDGILFTGLCEVNENNLSILKKSIPLEDAMRKAERITLLGGGYYHDVTNHDTNLMSTDFFDDTDDAKLFGKYIRKDGLFTDSFIKAIFDTSVPYSIDEETPIIFGEWCQVVILPDGDTSILPNGAKLDFVDRYGCGISPYFVKNKTGSYIIKEVPSCFGKEDISWTLGVYDDEVGICIGDWYDGYDGYSHYTVFSFCSLVSDKTLNMRKMTKEEVRHALLDDLEYVINLIPCS